MVSELLKERPSVIGFDLEWRPHYKKGCAPNRVALIQICYATQPRQKQQVGSGCRV